MENLKNVNINELNDEQLQNHREKVLMLEHNDIIDYILYLLDKFYDMDEDPDVDKIKNKTFYSIFNKEDLEKYKVDLFERIDKKAEDDNFKDDNSNDESDVAFFAPIILGPQKIRNIVELPDDSVIDTETINKIAIYCITTGDTRLNKKIKKGYEHVALLPYLKNANELSTDDFYRD